MRCSCRLGRRSCRRSARVQLAEECNSSDARNPASAGRPIVVALVGTFRSQPEFVAEIQAAEASVGGPISNLLSLAADAMDYRGRPKPWYVNVSFKPKADVWGWRCIKRVSAGLTSKAVRICIVS